MPHRLAARRRRLGRRHGGDVQPGIGNLPPLLRLASPRSPRRSSAPAPARSTRADAPLACSARWRSPAPSRRRSSSCTTTPGSSPGCQRCSSSAGSQRRSRSPFRPSSGGCGRRHSRSSGLLLLAPAMWAVDTLGHPANGTFPTGGPASAQMMGGRDGDGGRPPGCRGFGGAPTAGAPFDRRRARRGTLVRSWHGHARRNTGRRVRGWTARGRRRPHVRPRHDLTDCGTGVRQTARRRNRRRLQPVGRRRLAHHLGRERRGDRRLLRPRERGQRLLDR
jgi:hypothetical protein